jgi:hypothetical protein
MRSDISSDQRKRLEQRSSEIEVPKRKECISLKFSFKIGAACEY